MNLLLFLISFEECQNSYNKPVHVRCRVPEEKTHWSGAQQTVIYLHTYSKDSELNVYEAGSDEIAFTLKKGEIKSIVGKDVDISCNGNDCQTTIWHTISVQNNQYHVNDAVGSVFKVNNVLFPDEYSCFFDFGKESRVKVTQLEYERTGTVIDFVFYDNETKQIQSHPNTKEELVSINFESPGFFIISESQYHNVSFRILAGSIIRLDPEFTGEMSKGKIDFYNYQPKYPASDPSLLDSIPLVSEISSIWTSMEYVIMALSIILIIFTVILFIYVCVKAKKFKDELNNEEKSDNSMAIDI